MTKSSWFAFVCFLAAAATCGQNTPAPNPSLPGGPTPSTVAPGSPLEGKVLFAFKAGLDSEEQIWLWLEGNRLQRISTWPSEDPETNIVRSTVGYLEGFGRFGQLRFDHQRRFLLTIERVKNADNPGARPTHRLVSYELATGKASFASLGTGTGATEGPHLRGTQILASATVTMVLIPIPGNPPDGRMFEWRDGQLVPAIVEGAMGLSPHGRAVALDLGGEPVLVADGIRRRQQGVWTNPLAGLSGANSSVTEPRVTAAGDALCAIGHAVNKATVWLLTAGGTARELPCQGWAEDCAFSPAGDLLYMTGCAQPVVDRQGNAVAAPRVRLFDDALLVDGQEAYTLGVVEKPIDMPGPPPALLRFDWRTLQTKPRPSQELRSLAERCQVTDIQTPASGTGLGLVSVHCGCIDCEDGARYALDLPSGRLFPIYPPGGGEFIRGSVLLGSEVFTAASAAGSFDLASKPSGQLYWSDAIGTRTMAPLPDVEGLVHAPVPF